MFLKRLRNFIFGMDGFLLFIGVCALLASMYYFLEDDWLDNPEPTQITRVGQFSSSRNDVRRRIHSGFSWATVTQKDAVYEGDSIFTGEESEASIELANGGQIRIDPKSLVVVRTHGAGLQLDLQYGSLIGKVKENTPITISQNGRLQQLSGKAEIRVESSGPGLETKIEVVKGELTMKELRMQTLPRGSKKGPKILLVSESAHEQPVKQNEIVQLKPDAAPVIRKVSVELLGPANGKTVWLPPGQGLKLQWMFAASTKDTSSRVELSRDPSFATALAYFDTRETTTTLSPEQIPQGQFFWRVRPLSATTDSAFLPSSAFSITTYPDVPPSQIFPEDNQEFGFNPEAKETGKQILLSWEDKAGSQEFELQVAKDIEFKEVVLKKNTTSLTEKTPVLPSGTYYWRVLGFHGLRGNVPWSRTLAFKVEEEAEQPKAPKLTKEDLEYEIPIEVLKRAPKWVSSRGRGVVPENIKPFEWAPVSGAVTYEIEVAPNESFANSIKHDLGKETNFAPQEVKPGTLYVRVRAKGRKGLVSPPSETGTLEVAVPAPMIEPIKEISETYSTEEELAKGRHEFTVKWATLPFAETYELEWGSDPEFSQSKKFKTKNPERKFTVTKSSDYAARVRALGPGGIPISAFSQPAIAKYKKELPKAKPLAKALPKREKPAALASAPTPPTPEREPADIVDKNTGEVAYKLPTPDLLEPLPRTNFVSLDDSTSFVTFKWSPVHGATFYEFQVAEDADFTEIIESVRTRTGNFTLQKPLPEGRVFWRVRALHKKAKSDWSAPSDLKVIYN